MGTMHWDQADAATIQRTDRGDAWHAGHMNDALELPSGEVFLAADTGGLWVVPPGGAATPVGDLDAPDLVGLARGLEGPHHAYAFGGTPVTLHAPTVLVVDGVVHAFACGSDHAVWHYALASGRWSAPERLGGDVIGRVAACSWGPGRIDLFAVGTDGALWHKWSEATIWGPSQVDWESLGGAVDGSPAAVSWGAGRLDVFVLGTDGALHHKWFEGGWGPSRMGWEGHGGRFVDAPVALATGTNRLEVLCVDDAGALHRRTWNGAAWQPFEDLGGPLGAPPAAVRTGDDAFDVVARLENGKVVLKRWAGGWAPAATGWAPLSMDSVTSPACVVMASGALQVVSVDAAGKLRRRWRVAGPFQPVGAPEDMGAWVSGRPAIVSSGGERIEIVIVGSDGALFHKTFDGSAWSPSPDGWLRLDLPVRDALLENDPGAWMDWRPVAVPQQAGRVLAAVIIAAARRIVLACERGVWWSPIPASRWTGYSFRRALSLPDGAWSGAAEARDGRVVVARWGVDLSRDAYGLYLGDVVLDELRFRPSHVWGCDPREAWRVSVSSCAASRATLYAVASKAGGYGEAEMVEAVAWGPGRYDMFCRALNGSLAHQWWDDAAGRGGWDNLGGALHAAPKALSRAPGRLDVVGIGTNRSLFYKSFDGSAWQPSVAGWTDLGGVVIGAPALCSWGPDRLDVFVVGTDGALWHRWLDGAGWHGYERLGGELWGTPTAVSPGADRIDVLCVLHGGALGRLRWDGNAWSAWETVTPGHFFHPTLVKTGANTYEVYGTGERGNAVRKRWDGAAWAPAIGYDDLGGVLRGELSAVTDGAAGIVVAGRGTNDQVYLNAWNGSAWSGWQGKGGDALGAAPRVARMFTPPKALSWGARKLYFVLATPPWPDDDHAELWALDESGGSSVWRHGGTTPLGGGVAGDGLYAVLRSDDGGAHWTETGQRVPADPNDRPLRMRAGNQGDYNNCIAAHPHDPRRVVVGFRHAGPLLGEEGGDVWTCTWDTTTDQEQLHSDVHGVRHSPDGARIYTASDGGVAVTSDGVHFSTTIARGLHTLQIQRSSSMTLGASYQVEGLLVVALQDNGVAAARVGEPWRALHHSDGMFALSIRTGHVLFYNQLDDGVRYGDLAGGRVVDRGPVPVTVAAPGEGARPQGLILACDIVNHPVYRRGGHRMFAVGTRGNKVYGLFGAEDGAGIRWEFLAAVGGPDASITTTASAEGTVILVGFADGAIARLDVAAGTWVTTPVTPPGDGLGAVQRMVMHHNDLAFALAVRGSCGYVLRWRGGRWRPVQRGLPIEPLYSITTDWLATPKTLFVASDSRVYASRDDGDSWSIESDGLPRRPHISELEFVSGSGGRRWLYAATYGRSVFRAEVR